MSKYDSYGRLVTEAWPIINKGDDVMYITTKLVGTKRKRTVKESVFGKWDGEKVEFNDIANTIIRTTRWLIKK